MATKITSVTCASLTAIDGTDCIGDTRPIINNNFTNLGTNLCTLSSYANSILPITNAKLAFDGGSLGFRNKIINGGFDIWQRGTSFTGINNNTFTADRWTNTSSTATSNKNISRQLLGASDLPYLEAGLRYFLRGSYTSGTNPTEFAIATPLELNATGSAAPFKVGQTYTLSFYAKCASANTFRTEIQYRDISGLPTNFVSVLNTTQALTTSWARYSITFTMLAPNATNTSLIVIFANSTVPANTNIDITGVQLEEGPVATPFEQRPIGLELSLCQRYYEVGEDYTARFGSDGYTNEYFVSFKVTKRAVPVMTFPYKTGQYQDPGPVNTGQTGSNVYYQYLGVAYVTGFYMIWDPIIPNQDAAPQIQYTASAEL